MAQVFISHSSEDKEQAKALSAALADRGVLARSPSDDEIMSGGSLEKVLEPLLHEAEAVLFLVTPSAAESQWVRREWELALTESWDRPGFKLIPIVADEVNAPGFLRDRQWIRPPYVDQEEEKWSVVADEVVRALNAGEERDAPYRARAAMERRARAEEIGEQIAPFLEQEKLRSGG